MSILDKIFGHSKSPASAANPYLDQIPGYATNAYNPYINAGNEALGKTRSEYENLISDPVAFINKLMEGYKPSEGYQFEKDELTKELGNTAAAGGVAGTPYDQMNQAKGIQGLLSKDMQQFLTNVLGAYKTGLGGEQDLATQGFEANKGLLDSLGTYAGSKAGLAYRDTEQQNKNRDDLWSMFGKALTGAAGLATNPELSLFGNKVWG